MRLWFQGTTCRKGHDDADFCQIAVYLFVLLVCAAGIDVTANQDDELSDKETFQIEFDVKSDQWRVRTADNVYWKVADASGIQATDDGRSVNWRKYGRGPRGCRFGRVAPPGESSRHTPHARCTLQWVVPIFTIDLDLGLDLDPLAHLHTCLLYTSPSPRDS